VRRRLLGAGLLWTAAALAACSAFSAAPDGSQTADASADVDAGDATAAEAALDSGDDGSADADADATLPIGAARYVFVTKLQLNPGAGQDFASLADADRHCNAAAAAGDAKLHGHDFLAWLSDAKIGPDSRMVHGTGPYLLVDGRIFATTWDVLTSTGPATALDVDETKSMVAGADVWTGTDTTGKPTNGPPQVISCNSWLSSAPDASTSTATTGIATAAVQGWTAGGSIPCSSSAHLYCFEN
jgi:hypothetical protein